MLTVLDDRRLPSVLLLDCVDGVGCVWDRAVCCEEFGCAGLVCYVVSFWESFCMASWQLQLQQGLARGISTCGVAAAAAFIVVGVSLVACCHGCGMVMLAAV
jgi:hypothetical protein